MDRIRVAVLMGGPSSEHDVSLRSGANVVDALDRRRYEVRPVVITREGRWKVAVRSSEAGKGGKPTPFDPLGPETPWREHDHPWSALGELAAWKTDVALPRGESAAAARPHTAGVLALNPLYATLVPGENEGISVIRLIQLHDPAQVHTSCFFSQRSYSRKTLVFKLVLDLGLRLQRFAVIGGKTQQFSRPVRCVLQILVRQRSPHRAPRLGHSAHMSRNPFALGAEVSPSFEGLAIARNQRQQGHGRTLNVIPGPLTHDLAQAGAGFVLGLLSRRRNAPALQLGGKVGARLKGLGVAGQQG